MSKDRLAERVLNVGPGPPEDGKERRSDLCPKCGAERWELLVVPDCFFCDKCQVASVGPNDNVSEPEPEQLALGGALGPLGRPAGGYAETVAGYGNKATDDEEGPNE